MSPTTFAQRKSHSLGFLLAHSPPNAPSWTAWTSKHFATQQKPGSAPSPARAPRLRDDQWTAIKALVVDRRRALVVQRTGWGKSAVYFLATALLRELGNGPTVIVSPLLALMRNQIEAAGAGRRARGDHQLGEPRPVARGPAGRPRRAYRRAAGQSGTAQQPGLPRFGAAGADRVGRHAGGRRGALHLRLGPRLPAGLPQAAHAADRAAGRGAGAGHHGDRQRPRGPRRRRPARPRRGRTRSCCVASWTGRACISACWTCRRPQARLAWLAEHLGDLPGSGIIYTLTVAVGARGGVVPAGQRVRGGRVLRQDRSGRAGTDRAGPAGQPDQGGRGDVRAGHGFRQAGPGFRDPSRLPGVADRVLPADRSRGPRRGTGRGVAAARHRGQGHLEVLRLAGVPAGTAGAPGGRRAGRAPTGHCPQWLSNRGATCPGRGWRWCSRCWTSTVRCSG